MKLPKPLVELALKLSMVSLNRLWISSMLPMFAICSSSRIFSRRAFSSGVRFFLAIILTSNVVLLFYTTLEVYTKFGMVSPASKEHLVCATYRKINKPAVRALNYYLYKNFRHSTHTGI